jgi:VCBS repeat-containing protein
MSKSFYKLANGKLFQDWNNTGLITTTNDWSGVDSIMGYRGDGLTGGTGRDARTITGDSAVVNINANATNPNTNTTGGVTEFHLADPVVALQGSGTAQAPSLVLYLDASGRQNLHLSLDLRDIDGSADSSVQQIAMQYRLGDTGAWINLPGGYVADASTGPSQATQVTHLELDLPAALNNQSQVEIRILTTDAVGSDEWIGIDNIGVDSAAMAADITPPALASSTPADGAIGVAQKNNLTLNFNELIAAGTGNIVISDGNGDVRTIAVSDTSQVTIAGQTVTINPAADLHTGTTYHVSIEAGAIRDLAGNAYGGTAGNPIDFTTIAALTRVFEIQGAGHASPYAGSLVNTRGVVTAIDTTGTRGFWIQDQTGDGNDATSDGVFVFSATGSTQVHVGDLVEMTALVEEYAGTDANNLSNTELTNVQNLTVVSSGNTIAPTIIGTGGRLAPTEVIDSDHFAVFNPEHDAIDFYESLEGMLVTARDALAVNNTYDNGTWIVTDGGANATGLNARGSMTHSEGDPNPERIQIYADTGVTPGVNVSYNLGDHLGDVTGVVHYFGGNYELVPTVLPGAPVHTVIERETSTLRGDDAHLTAGAYNLENIDPNDPQAKFDEIGRQIANGLNAPDILGLEEIQDSNGTGKGVLDADVTLGKIVDAIVAAGGPRYAWVQISPTVENGNGGEPNGNIRNAILYNPARVQYVEGSVKLLNDVTPADGDSFRNSRHPLVADFTFHNENVTFVGIHNYSRLGSDEMFGVTQPPTVSGEARRIDQTLAVRDYVAQLPADANVIVAGDFNGYHYESAQRQLEANGLLTNLAWQLDPLDRYSSNFQGNNEQIDNLLVSASLADGAVFDNVHLNTNQPVGVSPTDHDAVLSRLLVNQAPVAVADAGYAGTEDTRLSIDAAHGVLANDSDANADTLHATLVAGPAHGTLTLRADGSFDYVPEANYHGADSFTYTAGDGAAVTGATRVDLSIASVNDLPVASADSAHVAEDATVTIDVLGNDVDADGDALGITLGGAKSALGASISVVDGKVRYTADADAFDLLKDGETAADSFTYVATDGTGHSESVTVSVAVREAGDAQSLSGSNKADAYTDAAGHDSTYMAGNGDDTVAGGDGADRLFGENGADLLDGGDGADVLDGGNDGDVLSGGAGADELDGGNGTDVLFGGAGADRLTGGLGPDTFVVSGGRDIILDFKANNDRILLGYTGAGSPADLAAWVDGKHAASTAGFTFADIDLDGNGAADGVLITGAGAPDGIVLANWTVATLVGQGLLNGAGQAQGGWLA